MKTKVFASFGDFLKRTKKKMNGVSKKFAKEHPNYKQDNKSNIGCWSCLGCVECRSCEECQNCENCQYCQYCQKCQNCENCENCI